MKFDVRAPDFDHRLMPSDVYFNNHPLKDVVAGDTDEGWVEMLVRDADGKLVRAAMGGPLARARMSGGTVRVVPKRKETQHA